MRLPRVWLNSWMRRASVLSQYVIVIQVVIVPVNAFGSAIEVQTASQNVTLMLKLNDVHCGFNIFFLHVAFLHYFTITFLPFTI